MLGISSKTIYAVAALQELSLLSDNEVLKIKEIAANANIPQNFLEQILLELKKQGLLSSTKGAYGGYKLLKKLEDITLGDVASILESDIFSAECKTDNAGLKLFWNAFKEEALKPFDVPLSQLKEYQLQANEAVNYHI